MTVLPEHDTRKKPLEEYFDDLMELHEIVIGFEQLEIWRIKKDIPERKSMSRFRKRFRGIEKAAVVIQSQKIVMLNRGLRRLLRYPAGKITGTLFSKYIHPDELPKVVNNYLNRMAGRDEAESVYSTILLNRKQVRVPVKLQVAKFDFLGKPTILGMLSRQDGSELG
jgi:PAS domain-containing protein